MKNKLKNILIAVTLSFLLSLQYIERYTDEKNRMLFYWKRWDGLAIIFSIFLIGLLFFVLYELANKFKNRYTAKILKSLFIIALGFGIIKDIEWWVFKSPNYSQHIEIFLKFLIYFLYLLVLLAASLHLFTIDIGKKIIRGFTNLCLMVSPIILVFSITSFNYKTWTASKGTLVYSREKAFIKDSDRQDVFIFIFDEWSYKRSYKEKKLLPIFKNLSKFQEVSSTFHKAYSPYRGTFRSMSNFIFQNNYDYHLQNNQLFFEDQEGKRMPIDELENIFTIPHKRGYFTAAIAVYHPYADMLGNEADFVKSFSVYKIFGENFLEVTAYHLLKSFVLYSFNFFPQIAEWAEEVSANRYQLHITDAIHQKMLSIIENIEKPLFVLVHYPVPHGPFVYNKNGAKNALRVYRENVPHYTDNMAYMDNLIGEIIFELQQSGKYESSLIVITSDHSWRNDPDGAGDADHPEQRHIPLFVKFPNQKMGYEINTELNTSDLFRFLKQNLKSSTI